MPTIQNASLVSLLLAALIALPACHKRSSGEQTSQPVVTVEHVSATQPIPIHFIQCDKEEADTVLNMKVTVRDAAHGEFSFPLKSEKLYDTDGLLAMSHGPVAYMICGDGVKNGHGIGFVGSASFVSASDRDVTINLNFSWTAADQSRGRFDQNVVILIGKPFKRKLSDLASIDVSFPVSKIGQ